METIRYIAFLRGINIGGHRVKMERMRELFVELGFCNVRSFIQTGNIFFETEEVDRAALTRRIEEHLCAALGYEVPTFLRSVSELEQSLKLNPFNHIEAVDDIRFVIVFISQPLPADFILPFVSLKKDYEILAATASEVFAVARVTKGAPGNPATIIEKVLRAKTTSRFYGTTIKIWQAASQD